MGALEDDLDYGLRSIRDLAHDLVTLYDDHAEWSRKTFGYDDERGPLGPIRHLQKEAKELEASPHDRLEYADALLLLLDASRRSGMTLRDLIAASREKLEINRQREWPSGSADQPVEHSK